MKEFNLDEYLKDPSQKVITKDGKSVRIICTDAKQEYPVIGLLSLDDKSETTVYYKKNGRWLADNQDYWDLFFAPIKREGWINVYKGVIENHLPYVGQKVYKSKEEAIRNKCSDYYFTTLKIEWEE